MKTGKMKNRMAHWHKMALLLGVYDAIAVNLAYFLALWFRFECRFTQIPPEFLHAYLKFSPLYTAACIGIFKYCKLYSSIWRYASVNEAVRVVTASAATILVQLVGITLLFGRMPITYFVIGGCIQFIFIVAVRFFYQFLLTEWNRRVRELREANAERVMIIGAGNAGQMIVSDAMRNKKEAFLKVCCIIDDNPNKWGRFIQGVPVVGGRDDILVNVEKYKIQKILLAIPGASAQDKRDVLNICKETGCILKNLPGVYQMVTGQVSMGDMKDVAVEDLLGREPIRVNMDEIYGQISGKVIMVTGGGGSIGSELCRQIAAHSPRQLIIFDMYENNAYDIQLELRDKYPGLDLQVLIGSVRDSRRLDSVFAAYQPEIVYHAAAHKHVPLMEDSPCESIKNNVIGTYKTGYAALCHGCRRFVLISTDKAVNPTNIMGASKRLCEMVIQSFDRAVKDGRAQALPNLFTHQEAVDLHADAFRLSEARTEFVAVRFGNVLGSNGSVIPLFKRQIARGGPVTVTHPDIIRYFMTIPEAVALVMQAGVYARGGEIFVLDMGDPVKIDDLARNLIKLSGHRPDEDIPVLYTGLRPGEKLYEEKLMAEEGLQKTDNDLIHIGSPIPFDVDLFLTRIKTLMDAAYDNDPEIRSMVAAFVPTYRYQPAGAKVPAAHP